MKKTSYTAKFLRFVGIVLMGLSAGFTLLGGIGTSCAAFSPTSFGSMASLEPYQWLYITFVVLGVVLGIFGIRATILLVRGAKKAYLEAMLVLVTGVVIGIIHIIASRELRGKSMPVDAVVYTTVLTLIVFLLLRIPPIWQQVDFTQGSAQSNRIAGGGTLILLSVLTLTIQYLMGPTHTWNGVNYSDAFNISMTGIGIACLLVGAYFINEPGWIKRIFTGKGSLKSWLSIDNPGQ